MQLTLRGSLPELEKEEQEQIDNLMRVYQSAKRYSFNRLLEKHRMNELKKDVMAKFGLNARYSYAAIKDAEGIIKSQKELIKKEIYETKKKLKKIPVKSEHESIRIEDDGLKLILYNSGKLVYNEDNRTEGILNSILTDSKHCYSSKEP